MNLTLVLMACLSAVPVDPTALGPRRVMAWQPLALVNGHTFSGRVRIKFKEGLTPVVQEGKVLDERGPVLWHPDTAPVPVTRVQSLLDGDPKVLRHLQEQARAACGCDVASMANYVELEVDASAAAVAAWMPALNALKDVEVAYPVTCLAPPPADIPPTTPSFVDRQLEFDAAPHGMGVNLIRHLPGSQGLGINIMDMEVDWNPNHEDLDESCAAGQVDGVGTRATGLDYESYAAHGTAVLSLLFGRDNGFGVTGFAPGANCLFSPEFTLERNSNAARALLTPYLNGVLLPGDVVLMESQTGGPSWDGTGDHGLVPTEWEPAAYDAVRTLTASGVVVVAAAGNGYEDLDAAKFNGAFNPDTSDSGAILVGAGAAATGSSYAARSRLVYSNYGRRINVQGVGELVTTAGYGDLFAPNQDILQYYSAAFAGTSSASPMVAGGAALLEAIQEAGGGVRLSSMEMRSLLAATGTPQGGTLGEHIGPLPNLVAAVDGLSVCGNGRRDRLEVCEDGNAVDGDGCSAHCRSNETCGNGVVDTAVGEVCDDGNTGDGDGCSGNCHSAEVCGNGVVDPAKGEVCDDHNTVGGDGCSANCASNETCGNGVVDAVQGEVCDDHNTVDGDGCSAQCTSNESCGNGIVDTAAGEECDDGNTKNWDRCSARCKKFPPTGCGAAGLGWGWAGVVAVGLRQRRVKPAVRDGGVRSPTSA